MARFKAGFAVEVSDLTPSADYVKLIKDTEGMDAALEKLGATERPAGRVGRRIRARRTAPQQAAEQRQGLGPLPVPRLAQTREQPFSPVLRARGWYHKSVMPTGRIIRFVLL